jgi:hypothetical protein
MREEADLIPGHIAKVRRLAHRAMVAAIAQAGQHMTSADQAIEAARSRHQANGPHASPATDPNQHEGVVGYYDPADAPGPDLRPLSTALQHINSDLPNVSQPQSP